MPSRNLTETFARTVAVEARTYYWDPRLAGFGLRVAPPARGRGPCRRVWVFRYRAPRSRRRREIKIGAYPAMDFPAARERALRLIVAVADGDDPGRAKKERCSAMAVRELCSRFDEVRMGTMSPKTARGYRSMIQGHVLHAKYGIGDIAVVEVDRADLQRLVNAISDQVGRTGTRKVGRAKKVRGFLGTLFNFAIEEGIRPQGSSPLEALARTFHQRRVDGEIGPLPRSFSAPERERPEEEPPGCEILNTADAAKKVNRSKHTMRVWRMQGQGPPYHKSTPGKSGRVYYLLDEVEEWLRSRKR